VIRTTGRRRTANDAAPRCGPRRLQLIAVLIDGKARHIGVLDGATPVNATRFGPMEVTFLEDLGQCPRRRLERHADDQRAAPPRSSTMRSPDAEPDQLVDRSEDALGQRNPSTARRRDLLIDLDNFPRSSKTASATKHGEGLMRRGRQRLRLPNATVGENSRQLF